MNSRRWIIPTLITQRPPWIFSVLNLATHLSLPQGSAPIGHTCRAWARCEVRQKKTATAAPREALQHQQWSCQLLPQKPQNRSQTGVREEQHPFLNPPASYMHTALTSWLHVITWNILPRAIRRCNLSTLVSEDPNLLSWEPNSAYIQPTGVSTKAIGTYSLSSVVFHTPKAAAVPWTITLKVGSISSLSWKILLCSCCFPDAPEMPR